MSRPTAWVIMKLFGGKGPGLFVQYASQYVQERQALKVNQPAIFEEGKDMLYRFMSLKDPQTSHPLDNTVLMKVDGYGFYAFIRSNSTCFFG